MSDRDLITRANAARLLIQARAVDPDLALSYVVWPTIALETVPEPRQPVTNLETTRMVELAREGLTHREIARQVQRPRTTVSMVLRRAA